MNRLIYIQDAIDALMKRDKELRSLDWSKYSHADYECLGIDEALDIICGLPSAQPTLYGYDIEHLALIARLLQKENLPPERVAEALIDIGKVVAIVKDEFEETLRNAMTMWDRRANDER